MPEDEVDLDNLTLEETLNYVVLPVTRNNYKYYIRRLKKTFGALTKRRLKQLKVEQFENYLLKYKQTTKVLTSTLDKFRSSLRLHFIDMGLEEVWNTEWSPKLKTFISASNRVEGLQKKRGNKNYAGRGMGKKKCPV